MSSRGSFCSNSPGGYPRDPSSIFDPFLLRENHHEHFESTSIVKLNSSSRVFCPICLENTPANEICKVSKEAYDQYVRNFFEALDQHSETRRFRVMFLPLIEIILGKRSYQVTSDYEFHKILRIFHKLVKSDLFTPTEFRIIANIFESVTTNFTGPKTTPLSSIWSASKYLLDHGRAQLMQAEAQKEPAESILNIRAAIATIIKTYFGILEHFAVDRIFEIIPPLHQNDLPENICRKYYRESQMECFSHIMQYIVPEFLTGFKPVATDSYARAMSKVYACLDKCITAAERIDYHDIPEHLIQLDLIKVGYDTIIASQNDSRKQLMGSSIRGFMHTYVLYFVRKYIDSDDKLDAITQADAEVNGRNILKFIQREIYLERIEFYLLAIYVTIRQGSKFFVPHRVQRIISYLNPVILLGSSVMLRAYYRIVARVVQNLSQCTPLERHLNQICRSLDPSLVKVIFCTDEAVFDLVHKCSGFKDVVKTRDIKFYLERDCSTGTIKRNLYRLMKDRFYGHLVMQYILEDEKSAQTIVKALAIEGDSSKEPIPREYINNEMSATLSSLLHGAIISCQSDEQDEINRSRLSHIANVVTNILADCPEFTFTFDQRFIVDLFELMEKLYMNVFAGRLGEPQELILLNELLHQLLRSRHEFLLIILKQLDFSVLGLIYQCISDYSRGDQLAESAARLLVAYDDIDYPIRYDVAASLCPLAESMFNWMLSTNQDLQHISLISAPHILRQGNVEKSKKTAISVGLMHMMFGNPEMLNSQRYFETIVSLFDFEEVAYNPLLSRVIPLMPQSLRDIVIPDEKNDDGEDSVSDESYESCQSFEEEDDNESPRLDHLIEMAIDIVDRSGPLDPIDLPDTIYASRGVDKNVQCQQGPLMAEVEAYERMAYETTRESPEVITID